MHDIITDYFTKLFKSLQTTGVLSDKEIVNRVTDEQNAQLVEPILKEEVKYVIFSMHTEKTHGYDELNTAFYHTYWSILEQDVVGFCQAFFDI